MCANRHVRGKAVTPAENWLPRIPLGPRYYARLYGRGPLFYVQVFDADTGDIIARMHNVACEGYADPRSQDQVMRAYTAWKEEHHGDVR